MRTKTKTKTIQNIKVLSDQEIQVLSKHIRKVTYQQDSHLFYKGHIPQVGHILLEGEIVLSKNSQQSFMPQKGSVIGVWELMNNIPCKVKAEVRPFSQVGILDRSTILEIMDNDNPTLKAIINKIIEE